VDERVLATNEKRVLITGGTGSFGKEFVRTLLNNYNPRQVVVFSRDELKQWEMGQQFNDNRLRFFIGDIRDKDRLCRAFQGVDIVVHAAALKQVPTAEYNPFEAIKTNIIGAQNIIEAAIDCGVKKVVALSTDKACNPVNLYGATKLCMEKLFINGNAYAGGMDERTLFSIVRYGNVWGSRGSVVKLFEQQRGNGIVTVTDVNMTRFWVTLSDAVGFVLKGIGNMQGGEVFVPKLKAKSILNVVNAIAPDCVVSCSGTRPGEKLHEVLITKEEGRRTIDCGNYYVIEPEFNWWDRGSVKGVSVPQGFEYRSDM